MRSPEHIKEKLAGCTADRDAVAIGVLWRKARQLLTDTNKAYWRCGEKLIAKRDTFAHGKWLPWLKANAGLLGFKQATAYTLMTFTASRKYQDLDNPAVALLINRELWGKPQRAGTGDEWYTPKEYIEAARAMMGGIDLDPASCKIAQRTVKAASYFTVEDDGLAHEWRGRVWLNPPYSRPEIFIAKLLAEFWGGRVTQAILLTHTYNGSGWFHEALAAAAVYCLLSRRIRFVNAGKGKLASPQLGQTIFYFGDRPGAFAEHFAEFGHIGGSGHLTFAGDMLSTPPDYPPGKRRASLII